MRVVVAHNHYQQPGGEDQVFAAEAALLEARGHDVTRYAVHNRAVEGMGRLALARATVWNGAQYRQLRALFRRLRPDVVHVHNTLPLLSPAVYDAAKAEGAAVVQTLHNYRLVCPSALLLRDGVPCELCVGKPVPWPGVVHACYRGSRAATAAVAASLGFHRLRGTYRERVDRYIALTQFAKGRFVAGGLPPERIVVKPNFLAQDPGAGAGDGGCALFVGRLSPEKGLGVLMRAWDLLGGRMPLRIAGGGPMAEEVAAWAAGAPGVTMLGHLPPTDVAREMQAASVLVVPSIWYEGFPMTVVEAMAVGTPVVASRLGALEEIVRHERTGLLFESGDAAALASAIRWVVSNAGAVRDMRATSRGEYLERFTAEASYAQLLRIYQDASGSDEAAA